MEFFKKHIIFFSGVSVCAIALVVGLVFSLIAILDLSKGSKSFKRTERNFTRMLVAQPSPVDENVTISNLNVLKLSEKLQSIRKELERGLEAEASIDGVRVTAGIQQYISKFTTLAKNHENNYGPAPIEVPNDFAFGFDRFKVESKVPNQAEEIAMLDQQRVILDFLISELFATNPKSIIAVKRHSAKISDRDNGNDDYYGDPSIFRINSSVTSKVEGAIDTIPFQISFSGKTNTLRSFLNRLAEFERPIVVRSINVSRPKESIKSSYDEDEDEFALFEEEAEDLTEEQKRDPVVTENISEFTLTLEYIEIVLPEDLSQKEDSI